MFTEISIMPSCDKAELVNKIKNKKSNTCIIQQHLNIHKNILSAHFR